MQRRAASLLLFVFLLALCCVATMLSVARAQDAQGAATTSQPACTTPAAATTAQNGSSPSGQTTQNDQGLSASEQQMKDSMKQLGSLFKKKPAASSTAASSPCPAPAASAAANAPAGAAPAASASAPAPATSNAAAAPAPAAVPAQSASGQPLTLTQMMIAAAATVPPAPAGGLDPSKLPDVLGVHIGTPTNQAIAQMAALYPFVRGSNGMQEWGPEGNSMIKYSATKDPAYISATKFNRAGQDGGTDEISAIFSGPPDQRAVQLDREIGDAPAQQTPSDTFKNALIQKYGPNYTQFPVDVMVWAFDEQGKPLTLSKADATCANAGGGGLVSQQGYPANNPYLMSNYIMIQTPTPSLQQSNINSLLRSKCLKGIVVKADIAGHPGGLASGMSITIIDVVTDLRNAFNAEIYLENAANATASQQQKNAEQQAAPKF
jgi:hypothetical protein